MDQRNEFLSALWPEIPKDSSICLWTLPDKKTHLFSATEQASRFALEASESMDVYLAIGSRPSGLEEGRRGRSSQVTAIPALAVDIDVSDPTHQKKRLFESREQALEFVKYLPMRPSAMVWSGGGIHAWWMFREPWIFESSKDRREAEATARGWQKLLRDIAGKSGKEIDQTWDLSRVLRMPGTFNHKGGDKREVRLIELLDSVRYDPSDFETWIDRRDDSTAGVGSLVIRGDADPPFQKFMSYCEIEPKFKQSWERKRKDFQDQSASGYDMSLATMAADGGWSDQEICDLMIASRRNHGDDLKLREDYYVRTITKARKGSEADRILSTLDEVSPDSTEARDGALKVLEYYTGAAVARIISHGGENDDVYSIVTTSGQRFFLSDIKELKSWSVWWDIAFKCRVKELPVNQPKAAKWRRVVGRLTIVIEDDRSLDASETAVMIERLRQYLSSASDLSKTDKNDRYNWVRSSRPFAENGMFYVNLEKFHTWIQTKKRERFTIPRLAYLLGAIGMAKAQINRKNENGNQVLRRYWFINAARLEGEEDENI